MPSLSRVARILAHVALVLIALFVFTLGTGIFTLGTGIGLSRNPTYGMLLWIAAGMIMLANVLWIVRASSRKDPDRK